MLFYDEMIKQLKELRKGNLCKNLRGLIILNKRVIYIHSNFNKTSVWHQIYQNKKAVLHMWYMYMYVCQFNWSA